MLSPHLPDPAALEVLLAVARTGSLNSAAAEVGVSQQAVSARVRSVEAQTGVVLVTRTPRGSTLTPSGVVVAEWAARLLELATEVDAGLATLRPNGLGRLRVSASPTIAEQLLPGWLVAMDAGGARRGHVAAEIVLTATTSDTVLDHLREGVAELAFVEGQAPPRGLRSRRVGTDPLLIVVRPDHPWGRRQRPVTAADLAGTALVTGQEGSDTRSVLDAAVRAVLGADALTTMLALPTTSAVRAAVTAGAGPAVLSELAVTDDLTAGRLKAVRTEGLRLNRTLRAVWSGGPTPQAGAARELVALAVSRRHR